MWIDHCLVAQYLKKEEGEIEFWSFDVIQFLDQKQRFIHFQ